MSRQHTILGLVAAIFVTAHAATGQEVVAERLDEVERTLAKVQELMAELLQDQSVAHRVIERVQTEVREALSEEQVKRMEEHLHTYLRRLGQNSHWLERLEGHKSQLKELQHRLHEELGPLQERLREVHIEDRVAHIDRLAQAIAAMVQGAWQDEGRARDRGHERELIVGQIETMRMALPALREEGRNDVAEVIERAIHAREMMLERRDDREARNIREHAPGTGQIVEILTLAERIYREYGDDERADKLSRLTERLWAEREPARRERGREREVQRERDRERNRDRQRERDRDSDREPRRDDNQQRRDLQTMEQAMHVFREAERGDAADLMRRALEARIVVLEGVRGREANRVRERAPDTEQTAELLRYAANLWAEFGHEEKAHVTRELAERLLHGSHERRETRERTRRGRDEAPEHREAILHRIEVLQERLAEMRKMIGHMMEELQELKELAR